MEQPEFQWFQSAFTKKHRLQEVHKKVLSLGKGNALVIEMLWSGSAYLPAHNQGRLGRVVVQRRGEQSEIRKDGSSINMKVKGEGGEGNDSE